MSLLRLAVLFDLLVITLFSCSSTTSDNVDIGPISYSVTIMTSSTSDRAFNMQTITRPAIGL